MNGRRRFLLGTVLSIQNSGFIYPACQTCCSRLTPTTDSRYECRQCGATYKEAAQRYKLCVKVSEERRLHSITIFGKCLEKIFGASADFLHSHLQASSRLSGDLEQDRAQDLLLQAAERCLIGRSFIFAVKTPENFDRSDSLSGSNFHKNMVACQIIFLNDDPMSCTVLSHFDQLVASLLSTNSINTKTNVSTDTTVRDLSALEFSESDSSRHEHWNPYADYWQQSLGFVSSPLSSILSQCCSYRPGECNQAEPLLYPVALTSQNTPLAMQEKINSTDLATHSSSVVGISTPRVKCSSSKHMHTNTHSPQHSSHFHSFSPKSQMALGQELYLQNVCKSGSRQSQSCSARSIQLPPQPAEIHQAKEEIWEDFPFSESLSEFIAKLEDDEGVRHHFTAKASTLIASHGKESRSCTLKNVQDAGPTQNYADIKELSHYSFDQCSNKEPNSCTVNHPCTVTRRDDNGLVDQTFPSADLHSFQKSFKKSNFLDVLSGTSTKEQDQQSPTCPKMLLNGTYVNDSLDLCSFTEDLDKTAMSLGKGVSSHKHNADAEPKSLDVHMAKRTMTGDNYNASADLFEASNDPEDDGTSQLQCIGSPNRGKERVPFSMTGSPYTEVLPYRHRHSRISVSSLLENYETWSFWPTGGFIPNLESTPILRRLSETSRLAVEPWCLNMASNSKSSTVSIRTKSGCTIGPIFLKNMRQRKSAMFYGFPENYSLWSPNLSPFSSFEGSTALIPKSRTTLADQLRKRETVLESRKNNQTCHNKGSDDDDITRTVKRSDHSNGEREDSTKHSVNEHLSPVSRSLQEGEGHQLLQSDWSPELFSEKSNISQPSDRLQRRLF